MEQSLTCLIRDHKKLHPSARARDIYKLLHQGTMGPRHLMEQQEMAHAFLREEFDRAGTPVPGEPLTEPVSIDGSVVRVNLRPFKERSGRIAVLFECLLSSAQSIVPDEALLGTLWQNFKELNRRAAGCFDHHEIAALDGLFEKEGFIALSHSEPYRIAEDPSYRVLLNRTVERTLFD